MSGLNVAQLAVTTAALLLMMTPLFVLAFLAGRRSSITGTNRQFERLRPDIVLESGTWQAEFDGDDPDTSQVILLDLYQVGGRIVGTGHSCGTRHSLEGILIQRRLCCIWIDENREGVWLGTVTAELQSGERCMVGMRSRWSPQSHALIVRKATFSRVV